MLPAALLSVVVTGSPAQAAVSGLATGSQSGTVPVRCCPWPGPP
jgi:hypothetical protein